jgi:hypothetical protein
MNYGEGVEIQRRGVYKRHLRRGSESWSALGWPISCGKSKSTKGGVAASIPKRRGRNGGGRRG